MTFTNNTNENTTNISNEDDDFYIIKSSNSLNIESTLSFISSSPIYWSSIENEIRVIHEYLSKTCHQFDNSLLIDQFTFTDSKMGKELHLFIQFITKRYTASPWLSCMGLLLVAKHILFTNIPKEVKKQLIHQTKIGDQFKYEMEIITMKSNTSIQISNGSKNEIHKLVFNNNTRECIQHIYHEFNIKYDDFIVSLINM